MTFTRSTATVTRPANTTQYASGDLIANSATAASVTAMSFTVGASGTIGKIATARLYKSDDDVTTASFRLHLFTSSPVSTAPTNGDNGAIQIATDEAGYVGSIDFDMTATGIDIHTGGNQAVGVPFSSRDIYYRLARNSAALYGLIEARGTYTPASGEVFTVELITEAY